MVSTPAGLSSSGRVIASAGRAPTPAGRSAPSPRRQHEDVLVHGVTPKSPSSIAPPSAPASCRSNVPTGGSVQVDSAVDSSRFGGRDADGCQIQRSQRALIIEQLDAGRIADAVSVDRAPRVARQHQAARIQATQRQRERRGPLPPGRPRNVPHGERGGEHHRTGDARISAPAATAAATATTRARGHRCGRGPIGAPLLAYQNGNVTARPPASRPGTTHWRRRSGVTPPACRRHQPHPPPAVP